MLGAHREFGCGCGGHGKEAVLGAGESPGCPCRVLASADGSTGEREHWGGRGVCAWEAGGRRSYLGRWIPAGRLGLEAGASCGCSESEPLIWGPTDGSVPAIQPADRLWTV
jgi:hypothetical protein